jgi:hypothetical protein
MCLERLHVLCPTKKRALPFQEYPLFVDLNNSVFQRALAYACSSFDKTEVDLSVNLEISDKR